MDSLNKIVDLSLLILVKTRTMKLLLFNLFCAVIAAYQGSCGQKSKTYQSTILKNHFINNTILIMMMKKSAL